MGLLLVVYSSDVRFPVWVIVRDSRRWRVMAVKVRKYYCKNCGWKGTEKELFMGEPHYCPKCLAVCPTFTEIGVI